jgi:predicted GNAT family N-acyltransferase
MKFLEVETEEQLQMAFAIREKVFVLEQGVSLEEEFDEFEAISKHFLVVEGEKALGTARYRKTEKGYKLERFAVLKEFRGKGVGKLLIENLLTKLKSEVESIKYLHAQTQAVGFYSKFGFKRKGESFLEATIEHVRMEF